MQPFKKHYSSRQATRSLSLLERCLLKENETPGKKKKGKEETNQQNGQSAQWERRGSSKADGGGTKQQPRACSHSLPELFRFTDMHRHCLTF